MDPIRRVSDMCDSTELLAAGRVPGPAHDPRAAARLARVTRAFDTRART